VTTAVRFNPRERRLSLLGLTAFVSFGGFALLAVHAWNNRVFAWDVRLSRWIHAWENRSTFLNRHVDPFERVLSIDVQVFGFLLVGGILVALVTRGRYRDALFVAFGITGAAVLAAVLKPVIAAPPVDPNGSGFSFPSGHAVRSMAAAGAFAVVAWRTRWRWATVGAAAAVVLMVGLAVVYHEWHWVSDVLAGWLLSIGWLAVVALAMSPRCEAQKRPHAVAASPDA
jgi:membrane-associated phospholipid phosphatase